MGSVEVCCSAVDAGGEMLLQRVFELVDEVSAPLLGAVDLEPDHPALAVVRRQLETALPGSAFELAIRLRSQADREYTLLVRDPGAARAA
jgi:hypothetical protein